MNTTATFGTLLRQARIDRDLTQEALAEIAGCATHTIRSFEVGRRRPSREMATRLADVLQLVASERDVLLRLARMPLAAAEPHTENTPTPVPDQRPPLTLPTDPLVGRQLELERLRHALVVENRRMVTLLGPGGIGKTRLALQTAADLAEHFADGAAIALLAPVTDTANLLTAIAAAVGCPLSGAAKTETVLIDFLRQRKLLLVLDNLEQLLGPDQGEQFSALIGGMLQAAPDLHVLGTSRERLRLRDEWVIGVDGLSLPEERTGARIERSAAVVVFLERARQVAAEFALNSQNRAAIGRICRSLGGVPLAIELAASWVRVLSCDEIAAEVIRSADFLSASHRDLPPRHQSLRAVLDHSWHLLAPDERHVLAHLSVFSGGCRREAITQVLGAGSSAARVLSLLAALVDKSLVRRSTTADGITRYDLHEFVRQYAAERLAETPAEATATAVHHAAYYSAWLAEQEAGLKSARQKEVATAILAEIANVRAVWQWACTHQDALALYRMIPTLDWFYEVRGWYIEAAPTFAQGVQALRPLALAADASEEIRVCYWLMFGREGFHMLRREPAFAVKRLHDSVVALRQVSQRGEQIHCIKGLAYVNMFAGNYVVAQALLDEAHDVSIARTDNWNLAMVLVIRGMLEVLRSETGVARPYLQKALEAARAVGEPRFITMALTYLGLVDLSLGAVEQAERQFREAHLRAAEHQDRFQTSLVLQALGRIARIKKAQVEAEWLFKESLDTAREISDRWLEAQALGCLGALAHDQGNATRARHYHRAAVQAGVFAPLPIALDELAALAVFELDASPEAAFTALAYVRSHPLTRPATRAAAAAHWAEATGAATSVQVQQAEAAAQQLPADQPAVLLELFPPS